MAAHSCILAWEIPRTEEPGGLQSTGLQIVRHNLATEQQQRGTSKAFFFLNLRIQVGLFFFKSLCPTRIY